MGLTMDETERARIVAAIQAAGGPDKVNQRALSRHLASIMPGRTFGSVYAEVRRLTSPGEWWKNEPVSHNLI